MSNKCSVAPQWVYSEVDVADNSTTVFSGPCLLRAAWVTTALSAHAVPILDGGASGTNIGTFAASAAILDKIEFYDMRVETDLFVDPNDSGTGKIIFLYAPNHDGLAGSGYSV